MSIPNEAPFASFLAVKQPWVLASACAGVEHLFLENDLRATYADECRPYCEACPVRVECGEQALTEEGGSDLASRYFMRAWMTPAQRVSIHRRGGLQGRDPMYLMQGVEVRPDELAEDARLHRKRRRRSVPPVPDEGDRWSKHLTTLARKLIREVLCEMKRGTTLDPLDVLCKQLECNLAPLTRVVEGMVQDGTLNQGADGTLVYRGGSRVTGDWTPLHLRGTVSEPPKSGRVISTEPARKDMP